MVFACFKKMFFPALKKCFLPALKKKLYCHLNFLITILYFISIFSNLLLIDNLYNDLIYISGLEVTHRPWWSVVVSAVRGGPRRPWWSVSSVVVRAVRGGGLQHPDQREIRDYFFFR